MFYYFNLYNKKFQEPREGTQWTIQAENLTQAEEKAEKARLRLDRGKNQLEVEYIDCDKEPF